MQTVLSVLYRYSYVEQVFSVMGSLWSLEKNGLETGLLIHHNINFSCTEFHNRIKKHKQLLKATRSVTKYNFKKILK